MENIYLGKAFAIQAKSDKAVYDYIAKNTAISHSQSLHYLQMVFEKISKAHIYCNSNDISFIEYSRNRHNIIAKVIPNLYREQANRKNREKSITRNEMSTIRNLCKEIDYLSPSVGNDEKRLDNCEYPWLNKNDKPENVAVPCNFDFPIIGLLKTPLGYRLLKCVFSIVDEYNV